MRKTTIANDENHENTPIEIFTKHDSVKLKAGSNNIAKEILLN